MSAPLPQWPEVGSTWVDGIGRTLRVTAVQPGSRLGRHVVGQLLLGDGSRDYACDLPTFDALWRDRRVVEGDGEHMPALGAAKQSYVNGVPTRRAK